MESGVISGFKVLIDYNQIGYHWFKVDIFLREFSKLHQIIKYIETNPHLYCVDNTLGYADLELEFYLKNVDQLHQIIEDLSIKFPKIIRNYTYFRVVEPHKFRVLDMIQI